MDTKETVKNEIKLKSIIKRAFDKDLNIKPEYIWNLIEKSDAVTNGIRLKKVGDNPPPNQNHTNASFSKFFFEKLSDYFYSSVALEGVEEDAEKIKEMIQIQSKINSQDRHIKRFIKLHNHLGFLFGHDNTKLDSIVSSLKIKNDLITDYFEILRKEFKINPTSKKIRNDLFKLSTGMRIPDRNSTKRVRMDSTRTQALCHLLFNIINKTDVTTKKKVVCDIIEISFGLDINYRTLDRYLLTYKTNKKKN